MGTIQRKCEFGVVHSVSNCRCTSTHVTVRRIACDVPEEHNPAVQETAPSTIAPLRGRMVAVLSVLDNIVGENELDNIADALEGVVKGWLRDAALSEFAKEEKIG